MSCMILNIHIALTLSWQLRFASQIHTHTHHNHIHTIPHVSLVLTKDIMGEYGRLDLEFKRHCSKD